MANPYGIEQVNIPGLLGMHQQMKQQRLQDLYRTREFEMKQKEADRADKKDAVMARLFTQGSTQPKGGDQSSGGVGAVQTPSVPTASIQPPAMAPQPNAPQPSAQTIDPRGAAAMRESMGEQAYEAWKTRHGIVEAGAAPVGGPEQEVALPALDQPLPPRTDGLTINHDALRELYAIDPKGAADIQKAVYDSDKQRLEQAQVKGEAMAVAATALRGIPEQERAANFQRNWAPYLLERGYAPQQLQQVDLSDQSLSTFYRQGRALEKIVASAEGERDYNLRAENQAADNARSDRADQRAARGEVRAERADGRAAVRFKERDKDRAALAASGGGVRSDTSDLNY